MKFQVSGVTYEFDPAPEKFMGDEILLLDDKLPGGWAQRWANYEFGMRDIVVLTYLASKRGGDERPFDEFVRTIAPLTFRIVDEALDVAEQAVPPNALGPMVRGRKPAKGKAS